MQKYIYIKIRLNIVVWFAWIQPKRTELLKNSQSYLIAVCCFRNGEAWNTVRKPRLCNRCTECAKTLHSRFLKHWKLESYNGGYHFLICVFSCGGNTRKNKWSHHKWAFDLMKWACSVFLNATVSTNMLPQSNQASLFVFLSIHWSENTMRETWFLLWPV